MLCYKNDVEHKKIEVNKWYKNIFVVQHNRRSGFKNEKK